VNPLARVTALAARVAHDVVTEYRRLDAPPEPARREMSCTSAGTERRGTYDVSQNAAGRVFGFGRDSQ